MNHGFTPSTRMEIEHASRRELPPSDPDRVAGLAARLETIAAAMTEAGARLPTGGGR